MRQAQVAPEGSSGFHPKPALAPALGLGRVVPATRDETRVALLGPDK